MTSVGEASGPMTDRCYVESLRDGREGLDRRERVEDVTTHQAFKAMMPSWRASTLNRF